MSVAGDLLDVNVWMAYSHDGHLHHKAAMRAWSILDRPTFCRITQLGFLRLLCNSQVMGTEKFQPERAWAEFEKLIATGSVFFRNEPSGLAEKLKLLTVGREGGPAFWTDGYLTAFVQAAEMRLVTFDRGFERFSNLDLLILKPEEGAGS